uniref:Glycoprotein n=1 Tax=Veterinary Pathology Zurich virus 1 TaxID=2447921 RepID=A0A3S8NEF4_9VIRU|nr:glycoprotein precursor [Veterinary Pathology Zurich virus 1]AZI72589.1 glycoprotein precursor [Veterinary Pathology Zurich virus 1]
MGAFQSITATFVAVVQHLPLIIFLLVLTWFTLMCLRGRWWKVFLVLVMTRKCQAYTYCSDNEFGLCSTVQSTIETKYFVVNIANQTIITKLIDGEYYFNFLTMSNCTSSVDFELVSQNSIIVNADLVPGCKGGWKDNNYFDFFHCRNESQSISLKYHGPFNGIGFWVTTPKKTNATELRHYTNLTFKWRHHEFNKHNLDITQNFTKLFCNQKRNNCRTVETSYSSTTKCDVLPLSVLDSQNYTKRRKRNAEVALTTTTSFISIVALDTGYSDSSELWKNLIRTQESLNILEKIVANLSSNQMILSDQVTIDQSTIENILSDLTEHGLRLNKAEKSFNNSHLCIVRNETHDVNHLLRVTHTYNLTTFYHDCKKLILVNDSLSGVIALTKTVHEEALQGLRNSLLRNYLLTLRWEYPFTLALLLLGAFFIFNQNRANKHMHYKKGEDWKCPYPHYPDRKGHCSCGKIYENVKLMECSIEKY